ncbi:hypothetical protein GCM10025792_32970 [Pseudonocardia tropica]
MAPRGPDGLDPAAGPPRRPPAVRARPPVTALIVAVVAAVGLAGLALERWAAHRLHRIRRARYRGWRR